MVEILDPEIPIIDPHYHLWDRRAQASQNPQGLHPFTDFTRRHPLYLLDALLNDIGSGHSIHATVYVDCGAHYHQDGPGEMRPIGETEYLAMVAEEAPVHGHRSVCAGVVGRADFLLGDAVARVINGHDEAIGRLAAAICQRSLMRFKSFPQTVNVE